MLAIASAAELQQAHSSSSSRAANRRLLQLPGGQNLMQGLAGAMGSQMLGNALNPNAGRPAAGNNAAGALSNLMTPQNMQAAMGAAQRLMGGAGRRLQQSFGTRAGQMATNNLRAQAATSQAIEEAVEAGANPRATRRAGATGSFMSWAAAQNDQRTFDAAERLVYTG
uniref:Uncharacterized protein n=1 Tax=Tetradesmus obliquus TaxID=3088 RepID=A0A383VAL3_TETOB|eukprot:jgi/Sobl393_1/3389/SZX61980.1